MSTSVLVFGAGPGLGASVARRFAREGHPVAVIARQADTVSPIESSIMVEGRRAIGIAADATDAASVDAAVSRAEAELGPVGVLVYNPGAFVRGGVLELKASQVEEAWRVGCLGGLITAQRVLPGMLAAGSGTILFTGATASMRGAAGFAGLAIQKFGLRALAQSMARELGPRGIHVAHVVVDGMIDTPRVRGMFPDRDARTFLSPDAIAEAYWQLHAQDATCWTQELDVRPAVEKF